MKNILFNSWNGAFLNPGGGEVQLLKSKESLERAGYKIDLFNMWKPQKEIDLLHQFSIGKGVEQIVHGYKSLNKPIALSTIMWTIPPADHPDFVHVRFLFQQADKLLTNSHAESERLSKAFDIPRDKFIKTRNSIADSYRNLSTKADFRSTFKIEGDFVLSVANIDTRKNTHLLVKACEQLQLQLITIGHIREESYYQSFKNSYSKHLHIGPVNNIDMLKSAYQQCSLFALPSLCETPGIAALEAASQGARIMITNEGAAPEYFQDYVTYCNPFYYDSILAGISHELQNQRDRQLIDYVLKEYTWDLTAQDIIQAYKELL